MLGHGFEEMERPRAEGKRGMVGERGITFEAGK
jgi:hypothetical protein